VSINLSTGKATTTDFSGRENRPILHRKESFVPSDHPDAAKFKALSDAEAQAGLLGGKEFIGYQKQWDALLASKGLKIKDHELTKLGASAPKGKAKFSEEDLIKNAGRTSITRPEGRSSHADKLADVVKGKTVIDWGQGKHGYDVEFFKKSGAKDVQGYDPEFQPNEPKGMADIVTNSFVGNVLPPKMRQSMWIKAFSRAKDRMHVAVRAENPEQAAKHKEPIYDGYLTGKAPEDGSLGTRTFQKFFTQKVLIDELKALFPSATVEVGPVKGSGVVSAVVIRKKGSPMAQARGAFDVGNQYNRRRGLEKK